MSNGRTHKQQRYGDQNYQGFQENSSFTEALDTGWITNQIDAKSVEWAKKFGEYLAPTNGNDNDAMTTSQIRKFFGEVKRIQASFSRNIEDVPLLSAKLAYSVGRLKGNRRIRKFYEEFDKAIKVIDNKEDNYSRFVKLLEATVAFHKFYGGKD